MGNYKPEYLLVAFLGITDERSIKDWANVLLQIPEHIETEVGPMNETFVTKRERTIHRRDGDVSHRNWWNDHERL